MKKVLGVVLAVLLAIPAVVAYGFWRFDRRMAREIDDLLEAPEPRESKLVTEEMLADLPSPVQRYLSYAGVTGKPIPQTVYLTQQGRIRQDERQPWLDIVAEEYYTLQPPGFIWKARAAAGGIPLVRVRDRYVEGEGNMLIKAGGMLTMGDARGPEMDQGSMVRYLNEMVWFPSAFLGEKVSWKGIDDHTAEVTFTDSGRHASAIMTFDDKGRPLNFVTERYREGPQGYDLVRWSTPFTAYGTFEGVNMPVRGQAVWHLSEGDLVYIEVEITGVAYDR